MRFRDAPSYLGMDRNRFNTEVRPNLTEIPIGKQGIGFDRLELDVIAALIDQPTTLRENRSMTAATYSQPSPVQM